MLPVLIVGAGPVGLFSALLLNRHGVECRIIDISAEASSTSKALGIHARTLEIFTALGIVEPFLEQGNPLYGAKIHDESGKLMADVELKATINSDYQYALGLPQSQTEANLIAELAKVGIEVERNTTLTTVTEHDDHVIAELCKNDTTETVQAHWILGCDGYRSATREQLKIPYHGSDMKLRFFMIDADINWSLDHHHIQTLFHPDGLIASFSMKNFTRIIVEVAHDKSVAADAKPTPELMAELVKKRWRIDCKISNSRWLSHFYIHERLADQYRKQHGFILGDAAHAHSPAGGQGMNTGLQDAYNLAWKLAYVIRGKLSDRVLDTYQVERRPIAEHVLSLSTKQTKAASLRNPFLCFCRNIAFRLLSKSKKFKQKFATQLTGLGIYYPQSSLNRDYISTDKLKAGMRAPTVFSGVDFTLLISEDCQHKDKIIDWLKQQTDLPIQVEVITKTDTKQQQYGLSGKFCLIRPDQYIAALGNELTHLQDYWQGLSIQ